MSRTALVIRPEPGNAETTAAARALGLDAMGIPLQQIVPVEWTMPPGDFDGLLIGSANVFRHGGERISAAKHLPVHAVGKRTAVAAREEGFAIASVGTGGLQAVVDALPPDTDIRLLRLGGQERVALDLPANVATTECTVYRVAPRPLPDQLLALLRKPACTLLHSASLARHFLEECERVGLDRSQHVVAALGPRIADAAGRGWERVEIASKPNDAALLAMVYTICQ